MTSISRFTIVQNDAPPMRHVFQYNWNNKLDGRAFMELVPSNSLRWKQGQLYELAWDKFRELGVWRLVELKVITLEQVNNFISFACFGRNRDESIAIMERQKPHLFADYGKSTPLMLLVFEFQYGEPETLVEELPDMEEPQSALKCLNLPLRALKCPKVPEGESAGL